MAGTGWGRILRGPRKERGHLRMTAQEAPLVVVPRQHRHHGAVHHLGLVHVEDRRARVVIEVARDIGLLGVAKNALELLLGGTLHRAVDLLLGGRALGHKLEIDHRHVWRGDPDRYAVELALELR